jgi:hypothetical protein
VRGRARTDSTHVLGSLRILSKWERTAETLRAALNALAAADPAWLTENADPEWFERYDRRIEDQRYPMHDTVCGLPRIPLLRTPVNRTPEVVGAKDSYATQHIVSYRTEVPANSEYSECLTIRTQAMACGRLTSVSVMCVDASSSRLFKGLVPRKRGDAVYSR